jgi:hemerythrin-like domain-containing protein
MITRRREFLVAGVGLGISGLTGRALLASDDKKPQEEVSALEDLMREHGVLDRILLIYEEGLKRLRKKQDVNAAVFHRTATLVRTFVEDYHEKLEENFVFSEFEKRDQLVPLVKVLREQHAAGRAMTDVILRDAASEFLPVDSRSGQRAIAGACEAFIRMYRPHAAREDTVLFPALRRILPAAQLDELGDKFEQEEDRRFGANGFDKIVEQVATIERELSIYDLGQFTARSPSP